MDRTLQSLFVASLLGVAALACSNPDSDRAGDTSEESADEAPEDTAPGVHRGPAESSSSNAPAHSPGPSDTYAVFGYDESDWEGEPAGGDVAVAIDPGVPSPVGANQ